MAFHIRAAILAGLAVLATAGYCSWQFSRISQKHLNDQKSVNVTQALSISRAQVELYVDKTANELTGLIEREMSAASLTNLNGTAMNPSGSIGSISGVTLPATARSPAPKPSSGWTQSDFVALSVLGSTENSPWAVEWFQTKSASISQPYFESQLAYLPLPKVKGDQVQFARIEAPDKRIYFVLAVQIRFKSPAGEEIKIAVGLLPSTYFNSAVESVRGSGDEVFVTDTAGFAYTYPDQQYVGAKMDVHPVVKRALRGEVSSDVREGKNLQGQLVAGGYEKLRNSNLIMVMTSPVMARTSAVVESVFQVALVSFALVLIAAGLIAFLGRKEKLEKDLLAGRLRLLDARAQTPGDVAAFSTDQAKKEWTRDFTNGIVQYLRSPLAAILGQSQLAISKTKEEEVKNWLNRIEKEARVSRDFLDGLAKSQGLGDVELQKVELEGIVTQSLQDLRASFAKNQIHLEENYGSRARSEVAPAELRQILRHLFQFQAKRLGVISSYRKITIDLESAGPFLRLKISDSAPAPEADVLKKIFEPFQTDGLQFSLAKNTIEKFRGSLIAEKSESGGLTFRFELPSTEVQAEPQPVVPKKVTVLPEITFEEVTDAGVPKPQLSLKVPKAERPERKIARLTAQAAEASKMFMESAPTNSKFVLNGQPPLEKMALRDLPPTPKSTAVVDAELKSDIVADEISVKIRKPKIDEDES